MASLSYRDADGVHHRVLVRQAGDGDWQVLDVCAAETLVVELLDGREDDRPQAEAIAEDYLANVARLGEWVRRERPDAIPEKGGEDAHSNRWPRTAPCQPDARQAALPHPAG